MVFITKARCKLLLHIPKPQLLFIAVWLAGLILGTALAAAASNHYFLMMRTAVYARVSIVGLAVTVLLPFLLTAFAVYKDKTWVLYLLCFAKVFTFSFSGFGITAAYGNAGWLIRPLFQFSDLCSAPVLCWFSIGQISGRTVDWKRDFLICLGLNLLVCCLDLCYFSPFLARITQK